MGNIPSTIKPSKGFFLCSSHAAWKAATDSLAKWRKTTRDAANPARPTKRSITRAAGQGGSLLSRVERIREDQAPGKDEGSMPEIRHVLCPARARPSARANPNSAWERKEEEITANRDIPIPFPFVQPIPFFPFF
jgi:hypothetical protein